MYRLRYSFLDEGLCFKEKPFRERVVIIPLMCARRSSMLLDRTGRYIFVELNSWPSQYIVDHAITMANTVSYWTGCSIMMLSLDSVCISGFERVWDNKAAR